MYQKHEGTANDRPEISCYYSVYYCSAAQFCGCQVSCMKPAEQLLAIKQHRLFVWVCG